IANFVTVPQQKRSLAESWLLMEAICDVTLAVSMTILLRRQRTGFKQTDNILNKLIIYSINTGTVTSVIAIVMCITFAIHGFGSDLLVLGIPLGAVYNFTMLTNLHYGAQLRQYVGPVNKGNTGTGPNWPGVKVDKTVEPPLLTHDYGQHEMQSCLKRKPIPQWMEKQLDTAHSSQYSPSQTPKASA
ncbi:uncharacterized protein EI90DRAFT_3067524, partial [Cantharellus anzutake]|uniref:uncharacterized protein n=1 Tax=Cantharellus anzutake TaxID=1750568 RepID=UPI00190740BA